MNTVSSSQAQRAAGEPQRSGGEAERPLLRVVSGQPSPEDLAALLAVVSAYAAPVAEAEEPPASAWGAPEAALRRRLHAGAQAWTRSGWQHGVRTRSAW